MVGVLEKWAQHRTTDYADDNVAGWGSWVIYWLVTKEIRAPWLAAGAERVLRSIIADRSNASTWAKSEARSALKELGL
jgi:hypothetical protein